MLETVLERSVTTCVGTVIFYITPLSYFLGISEMILRTMKNASGRPIAIYINGEI